MTAVVNNVHSAAHWTSHFVFLLASIGFAVRPKNVRSFPDVTGENDSVVEDMKTRRKPVCDVRNKRIFIIGVRIS